LHEEVNRIALDPGSTAVIGVMSEHTGSRAEGDIRAHHEWHSPSYVQDWISGDVTHDAQRRPRLRWAASLLPLHDVPARVLDVGGGYGEFAGQVLAEFPRARVCVHDYSTPMLDHARANLAEFGQRVSFAQADLTDPGWADTVDGPFDAVVSALAIHNLGGAEAIMPVYATIRSLLTPGGWFLNFDLALHVLLAPADSPLAQLYARAHAPTAGAGAHHHHGAEHHDHGPVTSAPSLEDHLGWLREAGFEHFDCPHKRLNEMLLAGRRPS
jgi:SAM-dependent methyltransferase